MNKLLRLQTIPTLKKIAINKNWEPDNSNISLNSFPIQNPKPPRTKRSEEQRKIQNSKLLAKLKNINSNTGKRVEMLSLKGFPKGNFASLLKEKHNPFPFSLSPFPDFCKKSSIRYAFATTLVLTMLIANPASLRSETKQQNSSEPPPAPNTGTPTGNPTPGTSRPEAACPQTNKPLTALVVNKGSDYTSSEYPTFWFYIPYTPEQISNIEFLLLNGKEHRTVYQTAIRLAQKPGIIKITIPSTSQYALKVNENYRWYLILDCQPDRSDEPDRVVNGWVQRKATNSQQELGYDLITNLAEQYAAAPGKPELHKTWANLLESLGYGWVVPEPFVESELLPLSD